MPSFASPVARFCSPLSRMPSTATVTIIVASAFLVKKRVRGKDADYYFITAGHAVENCRQPRRYLVADINQPRYESDGITLAAPLPRLSGIAPVSVDEAYDIALIRTSAPAKLVTAPPLSVGEECARAMHRKATHPE